MTHAEKCPICLGSGNLEQDFGLTAATKRTCHGCNGLGWVSVQ